MTVDDQHLGKFCYCNQHLAPHPTGWCTIPASDKVALKAENYSDAVIECRQLGLPLYIDLCSSSK